MLFPAGSINRNKNKSKNCYEGELRVEITTKASTLLLVMESVTSPWSSDEVNVLMPAFPADFRISSAKEILVSKLDLATESWWKLTEFKITALWLPTDKSHSQSIFQLWVSQVIRIIELYDRFPKTRAFFPTNKNLNQNQPYALFALYTGYIYLLRILHWHISLAVCVCCD